MLKHSIALLTALLLSHSPALEGQAPVGPIEDGLPRYPVDSVEVQLAALWHQRAQHPFVCLIGQVVSDASGSTYVQVDSLRVADEPWATCNDPAVMGMMKLIDEVPAGITVEMWGEEIVQQLVAVAQRQPNWRIVGVMFAFVTTTLPDATAVDGVDGPPLPRSLVPVFLWWPRTAENLRALDALTGSDQSVLPSNR